METQKDSGSSAITGRSSVSGAMKLQDVSEQLEVYSGRLTVIAARRIAPAFRRRFDPEDVVQSALRTFWRHYQAGEYRIETQSGLWRLLTKITRYKALDYLARHTAKSRSVYCEVTLDFHEDAGNAPLNLSLVLPSPIKLLIRTQIIQSFFASLTKSERDILAKRMAGMSTEEVAHSIEMSPRAIRRVLQKLVTRFADLKL